MNTLIRKLTIFWLVFYDMDGIRNLYMLINNLEKIPPKPTLWNGIIYIFRYCEQMRLLMVVHSMWYGISTDVSLGFLDNNYS